MNRRGVRSVALMLALLVLAACGGAADSAGGGGSEAAGGGEGESATLRLWHYEAPNSAMGIAWQEAISQFEETHPGVTVEFEEKGSSRSRRPPPWCSTRTRLPTSWNTTKATPRRACSRSISGTKTPEETLDTISGPYQEHRDTLPCDGLAQGDA